MTKTIQKSNRQRSEPTDILAADSDAPATLTGEHVCEAGAPSNQQSIDVCEEAIRTLAHHKWESAGCPAGDGVDFWLEAEQEVNAERLGSSPSQE